jgi:hypothetical protein
MLVVGLVGVWCIFIAWVRICTGGTSACNLEASMPLHSDADEDLIKGAVRNAKAHHGGPSPRWVAVQDTFASWAAPSPGTCAASTTWTQTRSFLA